MYRLLMLLVPIVIFLSPSYGESDDPKFSQMRKILRQSSSVEKKAEQLRSLRAKKLLPSDSEIMSRVWQGYLNLKNGTTSKYPQLYTEDLKTLSMAGVDFNSPIDSYYPRKESRKEFKNTHLHLVALMNLGKGADYDKYIKLLVKLGADPNAKNAKNQTPLALVMDKMRSIQSGDLDSRYKKFREFAKYSQLALALIRNGAKADSTDSKGRNILHYIAKGLQAVDTLPVAARTIKPSLFQAFIDAGVSPNTRETTDGQTPLHYWVRYVGNQDLVPDVLMKNMKSFDTKDRDGNTPLALALVKDKPKFARHLYEKGASLKIRNDKGQYPLDMDTQDLPQYIADPTQLLHRTKRSPELEQQVCNELIAISGFPFVKNKHAKSPRAIVKESIEAQVEKFIDRELFQKKKNGALYPNTQFDDRKLGEFRAQLKRAGWQLSPTRWKAAVRNRLNVDLVRRHVRKKVTRESLIEQMRRIVLKLTGKDIAPGKALAAERKNSVTPFRLDNYDRKSVLKALTKCAAVVSDKKLTEIISNARSVLKEAPKQQGSRPVPPTRRKRGHE